MAEIEEIRRVINLAVEYIAEAINDEIRAFAGNERISNIDAMRGDLEAAKNALAELENDWLESNARKRLEAK